MANKSLDVSNKIFCVSMQKQGEGNMMPYIIKKRRIPGQINSNTVLNAGIK